MGMIQTLMKKSADKQSGADFLREVLDRLDNFAEGADEAKAFILTPDGFEEAWRDQENLKQTDEVKAKYLEHTNQGRVVVVEIDW